MRRPIRRKASLSPRACRWRYSQRQPCSVEGYAMPAARKPSKSVSGISDGVVILSSSVPGTSGIGVPKQPANLASPAFGRRVRRRHLNNILHQTRRNGMFSGATLEEARAATCRRAKVKVIPCQRSGGNTPRAATNLRRFRALTRLSALHRLA